MKEDGDVGRDRPGYLEKRDCVFAANLLKQDYTTEQTKFISAFISHKSLFFLIIKTIQYDNVLAAQLWVNSKEEVQC